MTMTPYTRPTLLEPLRLTKSLRLNASSSLTNWYSMTNKTLNKIPMRTSSRTISSSMSRSPRKPFSQK